MNSGKIFEKKFSSWLHELPGVPMRIEDGGSVAKNKQMGDFFFFANDGRDFLFECKSTKQKSFPYKNISESQLASLTKFEFINKNKSSYVVINFSESKLVVAIPICEFNAVMSLCDRASMTQDKAKEIGTVIMEKGACAEDEFRRLK